MELHHSNEKKLKLMVDREIERIVERKHGRKERSNVVRGVYRRRVVVGTRGPMTSPCHASAITCSAININPPLLSGQEQRRNPPKSRPQGRKERTFQGTRERNCLLPHINMMAAIRTAHFGTSWPPLPLLLPPASPRFVARDTTVSLCLEYDTGLICVC